MRTTWLPLLVLSLPGAAAAELAALMVASTGHRLPASLDSVEAAVIDETVRVRARVRLDDIRGLDALGPLAGVLGNTERIEFTGTMAVLLVP